MNNLRKLQFIPQPFKDQGRPDRKGGSQYMGLPVYHHQGLVEIPGQLFKQGLNIPGPGKLIGPSKGAQCKQ